MVTSDSGPQRPWEELRTNGPFAGVSPARVRALAQAWGAVDHIARQHARDETAAAIATMFNALYASLLLNRAGNLQAGRDWASGTNKDVGLATLEAVSQLCREVEAYWALEGG